MEKFVFGSIILLFVVTGLIFFIKDVITAAKNHDFKAQDNRYYVKPSNWWHGMTTDYQNSSTYDSSSSCDSSSFDSGTYCGGGD
ncbi:MAG: hypothetical protein AAF757_02190 [Cyanobacteria bacterium P01_D01_bin.116]